MKIWITYASEDKEFVERLRTFLKQSNLEILDVENEILPGDNIIVAIADAIAKADLILVILSKSSSERQWFSTEVGLIISEIRKNSHKKIIPILKDKSAIIPPFINQYQFLDLSENRDTETQLEKLLKTLQIRKDLTSDDRKLLVESELTFSRDELLEIEKYQYEKQRKQKQKLVSITFLTTILATFITLFSFLISGKDLFNLDSKFANSTTIITLLLGAFIGAIVSLILNQFNKK